jgi:hypothetical protein
MITILLISIFSIYLAYGCNTYRNTLKQLGVFDNTLLRNPVCLSILFTVVGVGYFSLPFYYPVVATLMTAILELIVHYTSKYSADDDQQGI